MFSYEGKRAIVTGGGRGIGRAIAMAFAKQGADVCLVARSAEQLEGTADEIRTLGKRAWVISADLAVLEQAISAIDQAAGFMDGVDILVNNAGGGRIGGKVLGPLLDTTSDKLDAVYNLNFRSPLFASIQAAKHMISQRHGGAILNIVSINGLFPAPTGGIYGSAKAALANVTATMAVEWGEHWIRANAIAPSLIETELTSRDLVSEDQRRDRAAYFPLNRIGTPQDIAAAAVFLCSDEASWVSGITLLVAGGQQATSDIFRWVRSHNPVPEGMRI